MNFENTYHIRKLLGLVDQNITPSLSTMNLCEQDFRHVVCLCRRHGCIEQGELQPLGNGNGWDGLYLTGATLTPAGKEFLKKATAYFKTCNRKL